MSTNGVTAGALIPVPFAGSTRGWALLAANRHQVAPSDAATSAIPARIAVFVVTRFPNRPTLKELFFIFGVFLRFNFCAGVQHHQRFRHPLVMYRLQLRPVY